jgi:hypothetical protein
LDSLAGAVRLGDSADLAASTASFFQGPLHGVRFFAHGYIGFDGAIPSKRFNTIWLLSEGAQPMKSAKSISILAWSFIDSRSSSSKRFERSTRHTGRAVAHQQIL